MLTGLLYAAVIAMWAVVLLPAGSGTSDRYRDARTTQRFRRSLRSVSARRHRSHDVIPRCPARRRVAWTPLRRTPRSTNTSIWASTLSSVPGRRPPSACPPPRVPQSRRCRGCTATQADPHRIGGGEPGVGAGSGGWVRAHALALLAWPHSPGTSTCWLHSPGPCPGSRSPASSRRPCRYRGSFDATARHVGSGQSAGSSLPAGTTGTAVPREIDSEERSWTAERMLEQAAALRSGRTPRPNSAWTSTPIRRGTRRPGRSTSRWPGIATPDSTRGCGAVGGAPRVRIEGQG